ncbi:uncharacterized protein LOC129961464 [Argiope bruennichi]|uniref:uncharacterized protein LOC129961464 n=1 Tax=Argiope bruennichi TaxID=94029 RepID=UPI00249592CB|nr:uncharacterized protein LOC129961464 [Argiope bruennichi]XP_055930967.1 uncharacterized protein LOC129961464 [Argiope bruennichi]
MIHYKVRPLRLEDIPDAIEVALCSTYQYSKESLESWMKHDPEGIIVAVLDSGKVIGICATVIHNNDVAFGGAFCVLEEYRLFDVGNELLTRSLKHVEDKNLGLNCTTDKLLIYKNRGFNIFEESWSILEYEYLGPLNTDVLSDILPAGVELKAFQDSYLEAIYAYDRMLVGYDRREIVKANCKEPSTKTLIAFKRGICVGYGCVKINIFYAARVGPLYCNDQNVGEVMFKRLLEQTPSAKGLAMCTMSNNLIANGCAKRMGIPIHQNLLRLYTKEKMFVNTSKIFVQFDVDFSPF